MRNRIPEVLPMDELTAADFWAYEETRTGGHFNMLLEASSAAEYSGLEFQVYWSVLKHYSELRNKYAAARP